MKILKLDYWSLELSDYNLTFVHIKGTDNILVDAIFRVKTLNICLEPLENQKKTALYNTEECIAEVTTNQIQTLSTARFYVK